jgi:hypothetical protein
MSPDDASILQLPRKEIICLDSAAVAKNGGDAIHGEEHEKGWGERWKIDEHQTEKFENNIP